MKTRHHYIPQFYLRGFADPSNTNHILRYTKDKTELISLSIKDACVQSHYYSFTMPDGSRESEMAENFFQSIEDDAARIVRKIESRTELTQDESAYFSHFIAFQLTRVPAFRNWILKSKASLMKRVMQFSASYKESFDTMVKNVCEREGVEIVPDNFREFCLNGNYDVEYPEETSLQFILKLALDIAKIVYDMNWGFVHTPSGSYFLTSDNPVSLADSSRNSDFPFGIGLTDTNVELTFPLTKEICFLGSWQNNIIGHVKFPHRGFIWEINRRTIISATKYIFTPFRNEIINQIISNPQERENIM